MLSRLVVCALVVVAVGCGGVERRAATDTRPEPQMPKDALLGIITRWNGTGTLLAPVDRRTLKPGAPFADLGEYHDNWSLSPDRRLAAFGVSAPSAGGRTGVRVLDLGTFQVVKDIQTGIVAEALGWLEPDRLAAFLQSGEVVVVDPRSGQEISREPLGSTSCPFTPANAVTPVGFVIVVAVGGSAQLVLANAQGLLRKLTFEDIGVGYARDICEEAGMAVDPERLVAYVAGAGARIAEVNLKTMRAIRHRVDTPLLTRTGCRICSAQRSVDWLGEGRLAVTGFNVRPRSRAPRYRPAGVALVDTRTWTARVLARRAGAVRVAGDRLFVYDGRHATNLPRRGAGLRVHDRSGALEYTVLRGERVADVQVAGGRAYVRTARGLRVVDLRRGRVIARSRGGRRDVDLIVPR